MIAANKKRMIYETILESEPIPRTMVRSKMRMRMYRRPTIFITNIPDSSVAGPVSTQGKMAGHR